MQVRRCPRNGKSVQPANTPLCLAHGKAAGRYRDAIPLTSPETGQKLGSALGRGHYGTLRRATGQLLAAWPRVVLCLAATASRG